MLAVWPRTSGRAGGFAPPLRTRIAPASTAAVFRQELSQAADGLNARGIADGTAIFVRLDQAGGGQHVEVEGKRGPGQMQLTGNAACGQTQRGITHEEAEDVQARLLSEGGEGIDGV